MSFERLNGTLRRLFGQLLIESEEKYVSSPKANEWAITDTKAPFEVKTKGVLRFRIERNGRVFAPNGVGGHNYNPYASGITFTGNNTIIFTTNAIAALAISVDVTPNVRLADTMTFGWSDVIIARGAANTYAQRNGTSAQESQLYGTYTSATAYQRLSTKSIKEAVTCAAGASVVTTISIPKYTHLIGVTTRVTTAIGESNGTTGYQVGDGTDPDLWGAITGVALGTTSDRTNFTAVDALGPDGSDRTITLTATGGNFDGTGVIEVCAFYLAAEAD